MFLFTRSGGQPLGVAVARDYGCEAMKPTLLVALLLALLASPAPSEPLDDPVGHCDQQTLDKPVAISRVGGDRGFLREHVRSYGCALICPKEAFEPFAPERRDGRELSHAMNPEPTGRVT
jgi:hypothetical protein